MANGWFTHPHEVTGIRLSRPDAANGENGSVGIYLAAGVTISTITRMNDVAAAGPYAVERILPDQLLVSTPYLAVVLAKLNGESFKIYVQVGVHTDECAALGLTRIRFVGTYERSAPTELRQRGGLLLDVGAVLKQLRDEFAAQNAGWFPPLGKVRALSDNIIGGGSMIYKGVDDPSAIPRDDLVAVDEKWNAKRPGEPGSGVLIGMVDTRVLAAPPLAGALHEDSDMLRPDATESRAGHSTFVAGLILSVAPGVNIRVRGILGETGVSDSWEAAKAIVELGNKVDILNLSFGCITGDGQPPLALSAAIDLIDPKTIIVAAAGNFDPDGPRIANIDNEKNVKVRNCASFPAALDNVIAVGSAKDGEIADYSPHGSWVDVYADGGRTESPVESTFLQTGNFNGFATWKGTSFAAALITGAIAAEMRPTDETAHSAWDRIKARFGPIDLRLPEAPDVDGPPLLPARVITAEQWFNQRSS